MKIGILGFGLIGGSIAGALKSKTDIEIVAYSRSEQPLIDGKKCGILSEYSTTDLGIFKGCRFIFVCTPVDLIPEYVKKLSDEIGKDCIFTDVGSTKYEIYKQMEQLEDIKFIAGHPMAGSEKTGFSAANEHLYENAYYIIAPNKNITDSELNEFTELVQTMGALPLGIDPKHHDFVVAAISHVPHIIASALVNTVKELDDEKQLMHTVAAGGFKDITRIASSGPEIWSSICFENKEEILKVMDAFEHTMSVYRNDIADNNKKDLYGLFETAKNYRDTFTPKRSNDNYHSLLVDIEDVQGILAKIVTLLSNSGADIKNIGIVNSREYSDGVLQIVFAKKEDMEKSAGLLKAEGYKLYK